MEGPDVPAYQKLRELAETDWVPRLKDVLSIDSVLLPVIWDADFLYGPKDGSGEDTYVLCEINVSAVWPFPRWRRRPSRKRLSEAFSLPKEKAALTQLISIGTIIKTSFPALDDS